MKICIIGCGKMGGGIAARLAQDHDLALVDKDPAVAQKLAKKTGAKAFDKASEAIVQSEMVILAVKPQELKNIAKHIHQDIGKEHLVVSILAGVPLRVLRHHFAEGKLIRMMPNLPVIYGKGVVGIAESEELSSSIKEKAVEVFSRLGSIHWLPESLLDGVTALASSGIAFLCVMIESMVDAGIAMGLPAAKAQEMIIQLLTGTTTLLEKSGKHPAELKWDCASPAGTTIAGLQAMEEDAVRAGIMNTFLAAYQRSKEISQ